jgi:hypothetical protein
LETLNILIRTIIETQKTPQIFEDTREEDPFVFNLLIQHCDIEILLDRLQDSPERASRTMLLELLCIDAVDCLTVK